MTSVEYLVVSPFFIGAVNFTTSTLRISELRNECGKSVVIGYIS
jgi:hypothetical protein